MTTDTTALQERLWEAVAEVGDQHPRVFNDTPTDDVIAAVLPIIAAEVRAASEKAYEQARRDMRAYLASGNLNGDEYHAEPTNPYRATETGDRA